MKIMWIFLGVTAIILTFYEDIHIPLPPCPPLSACVHFWLTPLPPPLSVDILYGWPHTLNSPPSPQHPYPPSYPPTPILHTQTPPSNIPPQIVI